QRAHVALHRTHQFGEIVEEFIEAQGNSAALLNAWGQINPLAIWGQASDSLGQRCAFLSGGEAATGQVDEDCSIQHDIEREKENNRPVTLRDQKNIQTPLLQYEKNQMVNRGGGSSDNDGQPVMVIEQKGQQDENAEMHFDHAMTQVDMQGGHDHERHANHASQQALAGNELDEEAHGAGGDAADYQCLRPIVLPGRNHQGIQKHKPHDAEHDPVGFMVVS